MQEFNVAYFTACVDPLDVVKKFAESLDADYPILSDPDKKVARAYGVVHEGRDLPERWTFFIDKDGKIVYIDRQVNPASHGQDVVNRLKELKTK